MKTTTLMTLGALIGSCLIASAQESPQRPKRPQGGPPPEVLKEFDKDGDGKLSPEERTAMQEARKAKMEERRKEMLAKYDADKDGKLSPEERAAMPKPPKGPGGPGGKRGPKGKPGAGGPPPAPAPEGEE
jgi:hypothetical protein